MKHLQSILLAIVAAAALALSLQSAAAAPTKVRTSDDLNRQQLAIYQQESAQPAATLQAPVASIQPATAYADAATTESTVVTVTGERPRQDASDPTPATSPQLAGQPSVDVPVIEVVTVPATQQ